MTVRQPFDLSLYLVAGVPDLPDGRILIDLVMAAVAGGATMVQLRDKSSDARLLVEQARALKAVLTPLGVPLIVNDRADIALAANADGLHVGQSDLSPADARKIVGSGRILGLSAGTADEARGATRRYADYVGIGPLYASVSKADAGPALEAAGFAALRRQLSALPAVAIGGIGSDNAGAAIVAGADGVAVVSAICRAEDPEAAARSLKQAVEQARLRAAQ